MSLEQANRDPCAIQRYCVIFLTSTLLVPAALLGQDTRTADATDLHKKADAIRASADKLSKVKKIPWVTDVFEGFRLAKEEKRPIFLYTIVGDALEDC